MLGKRVGWLIFVLLVIFTVPAVVLAGSQTAVGITFTTPDTYSACVDEPTSDTITATGLSATQRLVGQIIVQFVTDSGRQTVPGGFYPVDHQGPADFTLQVSYPPVSQWPVQSNGTAEIHVDIQIEVYDNGVLVASFGPGLDWDVFCLTPPPPPPPPTGDDGCTPGYWKNHLDAWGATGYAPGDDFDATFGVDLFDPNIDLETAVNQGGGGAKRLGRHGVAALLSAAHPGVDYPLDVAGVIAAVQAGDADTLESFNELGCPLN